MTKYIVTVEYVTRTRVDLEVFARSPQEAINKAEDYPKGDLKELEVSVSEEPAEVINHYVPVEPGEE